LTGCVPRWPDSRAPRVYGRRKGRAPSARRRRLLAELLPKLAVPQPAVGELDPFRLFDPAPAEVWLEIGFGKGEHLAFQAAAHPDVGLIGCEPYQDGVASLLAAVDDAGLANVRIHPGDGRVLLEALAPASLARAFVLFPDPWPKKRHHKRRLVAPATLELLARALADGGVLRLASDDAPYLREMLALGLAHPAFDWPAEGPASWRRPADMGPASRCEARALALGHRPGYLEFRRRPRLQPSSSGR
jgi:tRNA (guanine-N7-)-methyltransferase